MTFDEIANLWRESHYQYIKDTTSSAYEYRLQKNIIPYFGRYENVTEKDLQEFVDSKLKDGYSVHMIRDMCTVVKMVLKFGAKNKMCDLPIEWKMKFPTREKSTNLVEVWNIVQQRKMNAYLKEHFSFRNLGILITMQTGMRIGEISGLRWSDFDLENRVVHVQRTVERITVFGKDGQTCGTKLHIGSTKSVSSDREIPLSKELLFFIRPLVKICESDNYVTSNAATPCEPRTYRIYFKGLCDHVGVPRLRFHGLRHTFATSLIASKCDIKTVSSILGHSDVSITLNTYVHPDKKQKSNAINAMLRHINSKEAVEDFDTSFLENNNQLNEQNNERQ